MTLEDLEILRDLMDSAAQRGLDLTHVRWQDFEASFTRAEAVSKVLPAPLPVQLPLPGMTRVDVDRSSAYDHDSLWPKKPSFIK